MENWKDIPGYEGLYEASTLGRIRTKEGKTTSSARFEKRVWKSRIMKGRGAQNSGYRVGLWKDGYVTEFLVHRLIAMTFLGLPHEGETVNHKDGNRFNNKIENLEWMSRGDNIRYGFTHGQYPLKGVVIKCNGFQKSFPSMAECSRFLERNDKYVSCCIKRGKQVTSKHGDVYAVTVV